MSDIKWTKEQQQAIQMKDSNILVAAAAGSGKTAVLVERIIQKITMEKIDIDRLLVVTFTNAAAAEMRAKILEAIYKKIEENPNDIHLQKQIHLLNKANICTIHSFCLDVIKNNFYETTTSANFRIGDTTEIELLKQETLEDLFEEKYIQEEEKFLSLIHTYTGYRGDEPLKELILQINEYIQSSPFPKEWLDEKVEEFFPNQDENLDFGNTTWGRILLDFLKDHIEEYIMTLEMLVKSLKGYKELEKFWVVIESDIEHFESIKQSLYSWDETYKQVAQIKFKTWPSDKNITLEQKEKAKQIRDFVKKDFTKQKEKILIYESEKAKEDLYEMYKILIPLKKLIFEFIELFQEKKKEKNIIDFHDIEHFALEILTKKEEGTYVKTEVAKKYQEKFIEIAIDEYQDSNLVQENILTTISNGENIFMVGDIKQSIYKFRQARPELFLEKYNSYKKIEEKQAKDPLKIQLFKNFRSKQNVLDITNYIFHQIMSKELGDIEYTKEEYLNLGADFKEETKQIGSKELGKTEINIINLKEKEETEESISDEIIENIEDSVLEARFVANRVKKLINGNYQVYDKKTGYRKITYKDIVILLRATSNLAPIYEKELNHLEIPVFTDTSAGYLDSIEVQTIMNLLKIIDNPIQDIPLVSVLRSHIGGFSDNELIKIRLVDRYCSFYESLEKSKIQLDLELNHKIEKFLTNLKIWRQQKESLSLDELIWKIYSDTGYYNYVLLMPNGKLRQANLKLLFEKAKEYEKASFRGLFHFIHFIEKIKRSNGDLSSAKIIGENENVIRIMSIHKSKGLEFPVVFLCNTNKQFNMTDLNNNILLHQDLGLGPKYINYERKIEYSTLAKEAMKIQMEKEIISEEMRLLYVALTRAKEKLIITGSSKDIEKSKKEKEMLLDIYKNYSKEKINPKLIKKFKSYFDWIFLLFIKDETTLKEMVNMYIHEKEELQQEFVKESKEENREISQVIHQYKIKEEKKVISDLLDWKYVREKLSLIPTKTSVTKLKEMRNGKNIKQQIQKGYEKVEEQIKSEKISQRRIPKFLIEEKEISSAQKGSLIHMCLQRLQEKKDYKMQDIINMIEEMVQKKMIFPEEAKEINKNIVLEYTNSKLWKDLKTAREIEKEKPFYLNVPIKEVYPELFDLEETILVQGVIDLYYIDKEGQLILVDYKTDIIKSQEELIQKYKEQLFLYKRALQEALDREVNHIYIYSTYLKKEIEITSQL